MTFTVMARVTVTRTLILKSDCELKVKFAVMRPIVVL